MNVFVYFFILICGMIFRIKCLPHRDNWSKNELSYGINRRDGIRMKESSKDAEEYVEGGNSNKSQTPGDEANQKSETWKVFVLEIPQECESSSIAAQVKDKLKNKIKTFSQYYNIPQNWSAVKTQSVVSICKVKNYIKKTNIKEKLKNISHPFRYKVPKCSNHTSNFHRNGVGPNYHVHPKSSHVQKILHYSSTSEPESEHSTSNVSPQLPQLPEYLMPPFPSPPEEQMEQPPPSPDSSKSKDLTTSSTECIGYNTEVSNKLDNQQKQVQDSDEKQLEPNRTEKKQEESEESAQQEPPDSSKEQGQSDGISKNIEYPEHPKMEPVFNQPSKGIPISFALSAPTNSKPHFPGHPLAMEDFRSLSTGNGKSVKNELPLSTDLLSLPPNLLAMSQVLLPLPESPQRKIHANSWRTSNEAKSRKVLLSPAFSQSLKKLHLSLAPLPLPHKEQPIPSFSEISSPQKTLFYEPSKKFLDTPLFPFFPVQSPASLTFSQLSAPPPLMKSRQYLKELPAKLDRSLFDSPFKLNSPEITDATSRHAKDSEKLTDYSIVSKHPRPDPSSINKTKLIIDLRRRRKASKIERNADRDSYLAGLEGDNTNSTRVLETAGEMASDLAGRVTNLWHCVLGSHRMPDTRDVRFFLYTRRNVIQPELLNINYDLINKNVQAKPERFDIDCFDLSPEEIDDFERISDENRRIIKSNFLNIRAPTKILIHGYTGSYKDSRMAKIKDAYLTKGRYNVIQVDWEALAAPPCYIRVTHHSKFVGETIAQLLNGLHMVGLNMSLVHLIGFSLGAQVAGFTGNNSTVVPVCRITGLDPALPLFLHTQPSGHLDKLDAKFVDVIHTCGGILAMLDPLGHVDFYPNGGTRQPGCEFSNLKCSHSRAPQYFAESVTSAKKFTGQLCLTWEEYVTGDCDNATDVSYMGEPCSRKSTSGKYYLLTKSKEPFVL